MKFKILIAVLFLNSFFCFAKEFYVAPSGNDAHNGSISNPVETIQRAQELAGSGDTVFIRGGVYTMREEQIAQSKGLWAYITKLDKNGISYLAYKNEKPVFDYKNIKPVGKRVIAFLVNGNNIHIKGIEIIGVQVTIKKHTQSECFEVRGSNNTLEQLNMHDNMAIGVYMLSGSDNLIVNCDAYNNWDSVSEGGKGGNTDGFGAHLEKGSINNVFRGCRAWFNSDDGFDLINNAEAVLIENCWAFYNGYSSDFVSRADGNGFKAGGYAKGRNPYNNLIANYTPIPKNTIRFCLALNPTDFGTDGPGWNHELVNNLGFDAKVRELANIDKSRCVLKNNYFDLADIPITASDFISLDEKLLMAPRQADGSLPDTDFLKLTPSSKLIDAGTDLGFSFNGTAPDLGCFEKK